MADFVQNQVRTWQGEIAIRCEASIVIGGDAGKVGVHLNGSRQKKHGMVYDFRSQYRALRLNTGDRKVLAGKLDELGLHVCFDHTRPVLSVGGNCRDCGADYRLVAGQGRA